MARRLIELAEREPGVFEDDLVLSEGGVGRMPEEPPARESFRMIVHLPYDHYGLFDHFIQRGASMSSTRSVSEVKARLSDCIREAEHGEPVIITRHGRPVAALVGVTELEALERLRAAGPEAGLASVAGGWEGSQELVRHLEESGRVGSRDIPSSG